ncbi:hypothetical protein [Allosalinactinospora lopnorensis]|uniref:hypothetical protein n=1 Tax=Allosalinactinospora lopnorensis TaxID=1352348 RepID=UPI003084163A
MVAHERLTPPDHPAQQGCSASADPTGVDYDRLASGLGEPGEALDTALTGLRGMALVWDDGERLRPVTVLRDILLRPAGLGPPLRTLLGDLGAERRDQLASNLGLNTGYADGDPADRIAETLARPERLSALLAEAGPDTRPVLDRLVWGPPDGTVSGARRTIDVTAAGSPVERLLARGLLLPTDESTVTLPREIALFLRDGLLFRNVEPVPPALSGTERSPAAVTRSAAGQAFTVIRSVAELLEQWSSAPPSVLRRGGLGIRDLRRAAQALETDEPTAAVLIETAHAAGLIAADGDVEGEWLPTSDYDLWRESAPERRWLQLAEAWLRSTRVASIAGTKDDRGRSRNILGEGLDRRSAPEVRLDVLHALANAPAGWRRHPSPSRSTSPGSGRGAKGPATPPWWRRPCTRPARSVSRGTVLLRRPHAHSWRRSRTATPRSPNASAPVPRRSWPPSSPSPWSTS